MLHFVFDQGQRAVDAKTVLPIVENLDVADDILPCFVPATLESPPRSFAFNSLKKSAANALSWRLPLLLMLCSRFWAITISRRAYLLNQLPWSERTSTAVWTGDTIRSSAEHSIPVRGPHVP